MRINNNINTMRKILFTIIMLVALFSNAQNKLPGWFLTPPVSPDNSCVYLIGISDPGLNRDDATAQAVARAKVTINYFIQKVDNYLVTIRIENGSTEPFKGFMDEKYLSANFETVDTYITNHNETIVLVKYTFTERPKSTKADSIQIKSLSKYYITDDGKNAESYLEYVSKTSEGPEMVRLYYSMNQNNNNDSITSIYETKENAITPNLTKLNCKYPNQIGSQIDAITNQRFKENVKEQYYLNNGLWSAYVQCFEKVTFKLNTSFTETLRKTNETYIGSFTLVKSMSIKDNTLEVNFGGTLYGDGFITVTYPEDLDTNIPQVQQKKPNRFALIIGNEDYTTYQQDLSSEVNVDYAVSDATTFYQYAIKMLGVPVENAVLLTNARAMDMHKAIDKLVLLAKSLNGKAELIFYYAGHGFPDEQTKEPNLIPVDVSGNDLRFAIKLKDLYSKLSQYPAQRVTVILDACFSGGARNQGLIAARGVKVKPKDSELSGNLVVFAASSGDQSSLPYKEKKHGMFTYMMLKKIQETKGDVTYEELFNHLQEQVSVKSLLINSKEQTPQTNVSPTLGDAWKSWRIK